MRGNGAPPTAQPKNDNATQEDFMTIRRVRLSLLLPIITTGGALIMASQASNTATGTFLYVYNAVAGRGGIFGVNAGGSNFFAIVPGHGSGFSTTTPPYPDPNIEEVSQARAN